MKCFIASLAFLAAMLGFHAARACDQCGTGGPIAPTGPSFAPAPNYGGMNAFQQRATTTYRSSTVFLPPQPAAPMPPYGMGSGFAPGGGYGASAGPAGASAGYMGAGAGFAPAPGCGMGAGAGFAGTGRFRGRASTHRGIFGRGRSRARFRSF